MQPNADSQSKRGEIPNLYHLLGLAAPETDIAAIRQAIDTLEAKAQRLRSSKTDQAKRAMRVVKVARIQLLNPDKKTSYDLAWRQHFGPAEPARTKPPAEVAVNPSGNAALLAMLPKGSPEAVFDLAAFLDQHPESNETAESDWTDLMLVMRESAADARPAEVTQSVTTSTLATPPAAPTSAHPAPQGLPVNTLARPAASMASTLRRKRKNSWLLPVLGLLGCLTVTLGLVSVLQRDKPKSPGVATTTPKTPTADTKQPAPAPRRGGLPQVTGLTDSDVAALGSSSPTNFGPATISLPQTQMPNMPATSSKPETPIIPPGMLMPAEPAMEMPQPETAAVAPLESAEQQKWEATLVSVSTLLSQHDYPGAQSKIDTWKETSLPPAVAAQYKRAESIIAFAQQGHAGLVDAVAKLNSGETVKVGNSAEFSFTAGSDTKIVIKLRGDRHEYAFTKLPSGMLYSLLDLSLDSINARAQAARAAFILFQPNRTTRSIDRARKLLVTATAAGTVPDDLLLVLDDFGI